MATIKGIKLNIGGDTSELTNALKGVNKEIRGTQSELREVDRLLKIDPNNTELLAQKQKLLGDNVEETKNKLEKLKIAGEQASDQLAKGDIGEDQFRSLQREVIKAEQELKKATDTAENFGKKSKKSFEEIGGSVKGAGEKIKGISAVAGGAATALTGMAIAGGKAADDINTLSKVAGLSTEEIQKFQYASEIVDVSVETLAGSMAKLTRNMGNAKGGTGAAYDAFETLGVSITDSSGKLRDNNDVFTEVIAKLGEVKSETDRDVLAMQLFGKSAQELNPLILGGAEDLALLGKKAEEMGLILDQDALDSANSLNDALDEMNSTVKASVLVVSSELAPILAPILEKISLAIADLVNQFKNLSPETKATILAVLTAIGVLAPLLIIIGTVIEKVGFIVKILPKLGTAINAVFTILKANPIGVIITLIVAVIGYLVHLYKTNAEFKTKVDEVWGAVKDKISSVVETIKSKIDSIVSAFKNLPSKMKEIGTNIINGIKEGILGGITAIKNAVGTVIDKVKGFFTGKDGFDIHSPSKWAEKQGYFIDLGLSKGITKGKEEVKKSASDVSKDIMTGLTEFVDNKKFYDKITLEQELEFWKQMKKIKQLKTSEINEINKKIYTASKEIAENEKRVAEEFNQSIESKAKSLQNFAGLFDKINKESTVTGTELLKNLQDQVDTFEEWQKNIGELEGKGLGNALIEELKEKGPSAHQEIKALLQLSDAELKTYSDTYAKKISITLSNAIKQVSGLPFKELQTSLGDMVENAKFATSAEVKQEQTVFIADAVGQSLLYGLQAISEAIFDALPKDVQLNIDGRKFASYNWSYLDREGYSRGRIFAPSENTIANIARSVMPKGEEKK